MNILHVLSQHDITGAERYAAALADYQVAQGHSVSIFSDTFSSPTKARYYPQPIGVRTIVQRLRNIIALRRFIIREGINIVHAHSRAASWVAYMATRAGRTPLVSTVHGRQGVHASSRGRNIYGERIIAVCDNIREHLIRELSLPAGIISVIPNCIDFDAMQSSAGRLPQERILSVIGRTSGDKGWRIGEFIRHGVEKVLTENPGLIIRFLGGDKAHLSRETHESWALLTEKYPGRLEFIGKVPDLTSYYQASSLVVGAGRIAIEALWHKVPVLAFGEVELLGMVRQDNFAGFTRSNFGDIVPVYRETNIDYDRLVEEIGRFFRHGKGPDENERRSLHDMVYTQYRLPSVGQKIHEYYASVRQKKQGQ